MKEQEATNKEFLKRVEKLIKEKEEKEEEHVAEIKKEIIEARSSVVELFWEAKFKLAEDIENAGSWDAAG